MISIAFSSLGLAFAVAAAIDVLQRRRERGLRRAYVFGLPLALYAVWYLGWGHEAENNFSAHNVLVSPRYVWEGLTASLDSVLALGTIFDEVVGRSKWGAPLADRAARPGRLRRLAPPRVLRRAVAGARRGGDLLVPRRLQLRPRPRALLEPLPLRRRPASSC